MHSQEQCCTYILRSQDNLHVNSALQYSVDSGDDNNGYSDELKKNVNYRYLFQYNLEDNNIEHSDELKM